MARLHRGVMRALINEIVRGDRQPGERLPKETALATSFGVSRGVARETIRALEERGIVSVKHGIGATVRAADAWDVLDPDVLSAVLETDRGADVLGDYIECRRILEVEAAGLAAIRARREDTDLLAAAIAHMEEAASGSGDAAAEASFHEADIGFHRAVISAAGNRALGSLVERMHEALLLARLPLARPEYRQQRALPEHEKIASAIEAGNPADAREAMSEHLATIAGYLGEYRNHRRRRTPRSSRQNRG